MQMLPKKYREVKKKTKQNKTKQNKKQNITSNFT